MAVSLTDYASQTAEAARARRVAQMLQEQAAAPIEVQTANGNPVPISNYSVLAKLLAGYAGGRKERMADKKEAKAKALARTEATDFMKSLQGTPEFTRMNPITAAESNPNVSAGMGNFRASNAPLAAPTAPPEMIDTAKPFVAAGTPPQKMAQALQSSMANGPQVQAPQAYGNAAPTMDPQPEVITPAYTNTPQEKMAMLMQGMTSGNPYMEKFAPAMYDEARKEEKSGKIFDAIGKANKVGANEDIMAAYKAANDPGGAVDYLSELGLKKEDADAAAAAYEIKAADTAEQRELDRVARADDREAQRQTQIAIAQMSSDTRRDIAAAVSGRGPKITEGQRKAASLAYRALEGNNRLNDLTKEGIYGPSTPYSSLFKVDKNGLTTIVFKSDQDRRYIQAFKEFIAPILRYDSGAAVPDSEVESYMQTYGNKFEDSTKVRWQKAQGRAAAIKSLVGPARVAYEDAYGETPEFKVMAINPNAKPTTAASKPLPPPGAVAMLKKNPSMAAIFDGKYGNGAAKKALGE